MQTMCRKCADNVQIICGRFADDGRNHHSVKVHALEVPPCLCSFTGMAAQSLVEGESTLSVGSVLLYHMERLPPNATATVIASPTAIGCSGAHGLATVFVSLNWRL